MSFSPAKLHKPNICIGNKIVKKAYIDNKVVNITNYYQSFLPYGESSLETVSSPWFVGVKLNESYFFFSQFDFVPTNKYVKSSNLQQWTEQNFIFENDTRQWFININDALSAYGKIFAVGVPVINNVTINNPNYCFYTTGSSWLTAQMPSNQNWYGIAYGNNTLVSVAGFPATDKAAYSFDGINWQESTLPFSANWYRVAYYKDKFIALPQDVINSNGTLWRPLSGAYSTNGINWTPMEIIKPADVGFTGINTSFWEWSPIYYINNKFLILNDLVSYLKYAYSDDGIAWTIGNLEPPWDIDTFPQTFFEGAKWTKGIFKINDTYNLRIFNTTKRFSSFLSPDQTGASGNNIVYRSTNGTHWTKTKDSLQAPIKYIYSDGDKHIFFESSTLSKTWRTWIINEPVQNFTTYSTNFIPLNISVNGSKYVFDQIGSNNPSLTCYKEANYDFIITESATNHPFVLRTSLGNTQTQVAGTYNNNPLSGINSNRIMFTPNDDTPDIIYYQCTIHPSMSGVIYIKDEYPKPSSDSYYIPSLDDTYIVQGMNSTNPVYQKAGGTARWFGLPSNLYTEYYRTSTVYNNRDTWRNSEDFWLKYEKNDLWQLVGPSLTGNVILSAYCFTRDNMQPPTFNWMTNLTGSEKFNPLHIVPKSNYLLYPYNTNGPISANNSFWLSEYDFSSVITNYNGRTGTLITPKHFIGATHYPTFDGYVLAITNLPNFVFRAWPPTSTQLNDVCFGTGSSNLRFLTAYDKNLKQLTTLTCISAIMIAGDTYIGVLDKDVDLNSFTIASVVTGFEKLQEDTSGSVPLDTCITMSQFGDVGVEMLSPVGLISPVMNYSADVSKYPKINLIEGMTYNGLLTATSVHNLDEDSIVCLWPSTSSTGINYQTPIFLNNLTKPLSTGPFGVIGQFTTIDVQSLSSGYNTFRMHYADLPYYGKSPHKFVAGSTTNVVVLSVGRFLTEPVFGVKYYYNNAQPPLYTTYFYDTYSPSITAKNEVPYILVENLSGGNNASGCRLPSLNINNKFTLATKLELEGPKAQGDSTTICLLSSSSVRFDISQTSNLYGNLDYDDLHIDIYKLDFTSYTSVVLLSALKNTPAPGSVGNYLASKNIITLTIALNESTKKGKVLINNKPAIVFDNDTAVINLSGNFELPENLSNEFFNNVYSVCYLRPWTNSDPFHQYFQPTINAFFFGVYNNSEFNTLSNYEDNFFDLNNKIYRINFNNFINVPVEKPKNEKLFTTPASNKNNYNWQSVTSVNTSSRTRYVTDNRDHNIKSYRAFPGLALGDSSRPVCLLGENNKLGLLYPLGGGAQTMGLQGLTIAQEVIDSIEGKGVYKINGIDAPKTK